MSALNNLACLLAESVSPPRPKDALEYSSRAYDLMQRRGMTDTNILDTHGWVLTLCDKVEGITILQQAETTEPALQPLLDLHYHLGEAYLKQKAANDAVSELEKAKKIVEQREARNLSVDPAMKTRIDAALIKAQQALPKEQAADTSGATQGAAGATTGGAR